MRRDHRVIDAMEVGEAMEGNCGKNVAGDNKEVVRLRKDEKLEKIKEEIFFKRIIITVILSASRRRESAVPPSLENQLRTTMAYKSCGMISKSTRIGNDASLKKCSMTSATFGVATMNVSDINLM